jgi:branched-subunit amino acid aminotransferase/4-amino-4-deoxychorismate lyase
MKRALACVDGRIAYEAAASVPIADRGFLYGDGVFETLRTYGGVPFLLDRHLSRLMASCRELGIPVRGGRAGLSRAIGQLLALSCSDDCYLRIAVTRGNGYGPWPWPRRSAAAGRAVIVLRPLEAGRGRAAGRALRVITASLRRPDGSPLARHKTCCYLESVLARREAVRAGADEALLLNSAGRVAELAAANIFAVRGKVLLTPDLTEGALPGITRRLVIQLAARRGLACRELRLTRRMLRVASEIFATNSLLEVCPVSRLDGRPVGAGAPGPVTAMLQAAYREEVGKRCRTSVL